MSIGWRSCTKVRLSPSTGDRHYIRVLQLLMRYPAQWIDCVIGMLIHGSTELGEVKPATTTNHVNYAGAALKIS
jgi:hypothetical protein